MILIHCGTNDLKSEKDNVIIADNTLGLAHQCKTDNNSVVISTIVSRYDNLNEYAIKVNKILREACSNRNIGFIDNENVMKYNKMKLQ